MRVLYSFFLHLAQGLLPIIGLFSPKIQLFLKRRKEESRNTKDPNPEAPVFWMHVASLGEYEQGLPLLRAWKEHYPKHQRLISFFSPSGYEQKKTSAEAEYVTYLPLDTPQAMRGFVEKWKPDLAVFVKYEIWPNLLFQLHKKNIPSFLLSARFHPGQIYFKPYGGWMRKHLNYFETLFVQNQASADLLKTHTQVPVLVTGDSRFDRVEATRKQLEPLPFIQVFKGESSLFVVGSSWPEDEAVLYSTINAEESALKWVIAPHQMEEDKLQKLKERLEKPVLRFSQLSIYKTGKAELSTEEIERLKEAQVLILDTVGYLSRVYQYADAAFIGGAFRTGLHNILEAVVFGIPVWIGPHYDKFPEAGDLVEKGSVISVRSPEEFQASLQQSMSSPEQKKKIYQSSRSYCEQQLGATQKAMDVLSRFSKIP